MYNNEGLADMLLVPMNILTESEDEPYARTQR